MLRTDRRRRRRWSEFGWVPLLLLIIIRAPAWAGLWGVSPIKNRKKGSSCRKRCVLSPQETMTSLALTVRRRWPGMPRRSRLHTLMSTFPDMKLERRRPPRDPPAPPCLLHSALTQKLICADTSAKNKKIDQCALGKTLPAGLTGDYWAWIQLMQTVVRSEKTNCSNLTNKTGASACTCFIRVV